MGKRGRPAIPITDEMLRQAQSLGGYGLKYEQIATILNISLGKLKTSPDLIDAIKKGKEVAAGNLHKTAYEMAVKDKNPAMVMFMLKCQHGWREKNDLDVHHHIKPIIIHKRDGSTIELRNEAREALDDDSVESPRLVGKSEDQDNA